MNILSQFTTVVLVFLLFPMGLFSQQSAFKEILFLGMAEAGSPALSQSFDQLLRTRLSAEPGIKTSDYQQSLRYREQVSFSRYPTISSGLLVKLQRVLPDSLVLLWGKIVSTEITPSRKGLFGSVFNADLKLNLTIYNPDQKTFIFNGIIATEKTTPGPMIFFSSINNTAMIDAALRSAILQELLEKAADKSASMITSLLQNNRKLKVEDAAPDKPADNSPSISDVFSVPSVAPTSIIDRDTKDSLK